MRYTLLALAGLLLTTAVSFGQQPPPQPEALNPQKFPEDWLLVKWENAMNEVNDLVADCEYTSTDKVIGVKDVFRGQAKYLRTANATMASLELHHEKKKGVFLKYVFTGTFLYQFVPESKTIFVHKMPKGGAGQAGNNLLTFLFGMKAAEAKQRYELRFIPPPPNDKFYYYLSIKPRTNQDKQDFVEARWVLTKESFLVRQLWFKEANGNEVQLDFPAAAVNKQGAKAIDFGTPKTPDGWQMKMAPDLNNPKIIHNGQ